MSIKLTMHGHLFLCCYMLTLEVINKLLNIMTMIFQKKEVPSNFWKTLIKPLYKKHDKSECDNHWGISQVSVGSKLLSSMMLFNLRDKALREEQCGFRKDRGCVDQIFTIRLPIRNALVIKHLWSSVL